MVYCGFACFVIVFNGLFVFWGFLKFLKVSFVFLVSFGFCGFVKNVDKPLKRTLNAAGNQH